MWWFAPSESVFRRCQMVTSLHEIPLTLVDTIRSESLKGSR